MCPVKTDVVLVSLEISVSCSCCDLYNWPKHGESQTERGDARSAPVIISVKNSRSILLLLLLWLISEN